jgi:branched-chain amino acid transport system permease protein
MFSKPWMVTGFWRSWLAPIALIIILGTFPPLLGTNFDLGRLELVFVLALGALSLNFADSYGGQFALGQPVLIAVAAYAAGILSSQLQWDIWQTAALAIAAAIALSVLLGLPSLRVRGWYLAVVTFFAVSVLPDFVSAFAPVTGGDDGLNGIRPIQFGAYLLPPQAVYELFLLAVIIVFVGIANLIASGWGLSLLTLRDHPRVIDSCGTNSLLMKLWIYVLLAIPCGFAGVLLAHSQQFVSAAQFNFNMLLLFVGSVFLGGRGTLWGPIVGLAIFETISLWLGPFSPYNPLFLGLGVLISALAFRGGLVPVLARLGNRLRPRAPSPVIALEPPTSLEHREGPELVIKAVSKHFGGNVALDGVSFGVAPGQVVALVGANGSGKTTLLNVISGFVKADTGSLTLNKVDIARLAPHLRARLGVGRSFQVPKLVHEFTVRENVEVGIVGPRKQRVLGAVFRLLSFRREEVERRQRAENLCRAIGFGKALTDLPAGRLPLGLQRIVEIGRVLGSGSSLVCLDEPVAGLNSDEQSQVAAIIRRIADSGRAILLVEHNLGFVRDLADLIVLLKEGRVVESGRREACLDPDTEIGRYFQTFVTAEPSGLAESSASS